MKNRFHHTKSAAAFAGLALLACTAQGAVILQPQSITATSQAGGQYAGNFAADQSGFLGGGSYTSGVTNFDEALTLEHRQGNGGTEGGTNIGWASVFNPTLNIDPQAANNPGVLIIDMGSVVTVSRIGVWTYLLGTPVNGGAAFDSTKDFEVFSSDSGNLATAALTSLGVFTLPDEHPSRTGLAFDITDATSQFFVINVRSLHTDTSPVGNNHASFGEIAFEAIPEPSAALLGGLGLLALLRRRR
ncbi:MAG: hypothetical protein ACNA77_10205 [Opitutales bacterium]